MTLLDEFMSLRDRVPFYEYPDLEYWGKNPDRWDFMCSQIFLSMAESINLFTLKYYPALVGAMSLPNWRDIVQLDHDISTMPKEDLEKLSESQGYVVDWGDDDE